PVPVPAKASTPGPVPVPAPALVSKPAAPAPASVSPAPAAPSTSGERIHSSPLVRRKAKEHGIDLSTVAGTGAGGRISKQDIEAVIASGGAPAAAPSAASAPAARPAAPPPAAAGAQAHVALEMAVPREKIYFGNYEVQPMSTMRQRIAE